MEDTVKFVSIVEKIIKIKTTACLIEDRIKKLETNFKQKKKIFF